MIFGREFESRELHSASSSKLLVLLRLQESSSWLLPFALRAFGCVCLCARAREQIRNPFARKKEGTSTTTTTTTTRGTSSERRKRFICALEKDDLGRERKPFLFCFFSFCMKWDPRQREKLCVCVCHDNSGTIREEKLLSFFFGFGGGWQPRDSILSRTLGRDRKKKKTEIERDNRSGC